DRELAVRPGTGPGPAVLTVHSLCCQTLFILPPDQAPSPPLPLHILPDYARRKPITLLL
ncbi:hypothetical protein GOODEAATRI_008219, partial [Goodea atripinnis]